MYARRYFRDMDDGTPLYFRRWTAIGPEFTKDPELAERFSTEEQAGWITFSLAPMDTVPHPLIEEPETDDQE